MRAFATRAFVVGALAALAVLPGAGCGDDRNPDPILVLAAASMTDALVEATAAFEEDFGGEVVFSFGGSNALARQVELGAPADAVIFAGTSPMDQLESSGHILAGSRVDLLRNRLVVIEQAGSTQLGDLGELALADGRIALADPALAPAGLYAKQSLEMSGLWDGLESRHIPTLDVRAAVGAVATGNAAFGLVYATDAAAASGVEVVLGVPETLHDPIIYPAAIVDGAGGVDGARAFLEYLVGAKGGAVFERHGFVMLSD